MSARPGDLRSRDDGAGGDVPGTRAGTPPPSAAPGAPETLRASQFKGVIGWKLVEYSGLVLFAGVVPPAMGPDLYGRFAGLLAFIALLTVLSGLGALPAFGRFVPEYRVAEDDAMVRVLFTQYFAVRTAITIVLAATFMVAFPRLLPDASSATVLLGVTALLVSVPAATCFQLFYGLNRMGHWLSYEALLKGIMLAVVLAVGGLHDLERAALAILVTQAGFLVAGVWLARRYFTVEGRVLDRAVLGRHIRFGVLFFLGGLFLTAVWRLGELTLLAFSIAPSEVAFFNVANLVALLVAGMIAQLASILAPSLAVFHFENQQRRLTEWLGFSLKYLMVLAFAFVLGVHTFGTIGVEAVWGDAFAPVADNLEILSLGVVAFPLLRTVVTLAILHDQPTRLFRIALVALVVFAAVAAVATPAWESRGVSVAVTVALAAAAVVARGEFGIGTALAAARFRSHLAIGLVTGVVLVLPLPGVTRGLAATAVYVGLVLGLRVVDTRELAVIAREVRGRRPAPGTDAVTTDG